MKTIKIGAPYFMCIDEEAQKLYSIGHRKSVIDMNSATVQTQIKGFRYAKRTLFIHKYGLLFLETNNQEYWLLDINDYSIIKRLKCHAMPDKNNTNLAKTQLFTRFFANSRTMYVQYYRSRLCNKSSKISAFLLPASLTACF